MSRGGSRRGEHSRGDFQTSVDGWNVAGGSGPTRPPAKAGDLSQFGKIQRNSGISLGPSSVFSSKKDGKGKDTPPGSLSRAASTSNMFSILNSTGEVPAETPRRPSSRKTSVDLGNASSGVPDTPIRRKLQLLPRTVASANAEEKVDEEEPTESEEEGAGSSMTDEQAKAKIDEDVKEYFMLKDTGEAEKYFSDLPEAYRHKLVDKLVSRAFEGKEADIRMVAELFSRVANGKTCGPVAFEQGLMGTIEFIDDIAIDVPLAYTFASILLKGSGLSQEAVEGLADKINVEGEPMIAPRDKLLREYAKLA